jgi:hypothetical protein
VALIRHVSLGGDVCYFPTLHHCLVPAHSPFHRFFAIGRHYCPSRSSMKPPFKSLCELFPEPIEDDMAGQLKAVGTSPNDIREAGAGAGKS